MGELQRKIEILGNASKFDICASMASPRNVFNGDRIGNPHHAGICHAFSPDGRCISLFKVLMTNYCLNDCFYCINRCSKAKLKTMFTPEELAKAFIGLYIRNYVEGLFLSSGVLKSVYETTEKIIEAIDLIRYQYKFRGYIHIKILPGTEKYQIRRIMEIADRVSLNIEVPSATRLTEVSSTKDYILDIIRPQKIIMQLIESGLTPAGHTTQFIIGASSESDKEIFERLVWEYKHYNLKRGYFSAFTPMKETPLEKVKLPYTISKRENFLYRIDWLFRKYSYKKEEIISILNEDGMLPLHIDPKLAIAFEDKIFPLDVNEASYEELLRCPGIGEVSAKRICNLRKINHKIKSYKDLCQLGVVLKRAKPFLIVNGRKQTNLNGFFN